LPLSSTPIITIFNYCESNSVFISNYDYYLPLLSKAAALAALAEKSGPPHQTVPIIGLAVPRRISVLTTDLLPKA